MPGPWKLHGYVVERLLGAGASGEVWRARVAATGEPVALKRLAPTDSRVNRRLHSEAAMLAALDHPNLIRLHAVVPDEQVAGGSVLVLDLAEGDSLAQLLSVRGRLSPGEVVTSLAPVAAALAYAHTQGVVHGDISAANVLFTAEGTALLADLGVARLAGDDREAESTPAYVDPAVAVGCVPAPSSDVFMLGGVALHALTGSPTWRGSAEAALAAARAGALDDVAERLAAAEVPEPVAKVVSRALCPDSFRRGTAADFALELRAAAEPVAVELRAGRSRDALLRGVRSAVAGPERGRPRGGRHAAITPAAAGPPLPWRPIAPESDGSAAANGPDDRQPPTQALQPRPRPQLPQPGRRRPPARRLAFAGLAVLAVAIAVFVVVRPGEGTHPAAAALPAGTAFTTGSASPVGSASPAGSAAPARSAAPVPGGTVPAAGLSSGPAPTAATSAVQVSSPTPSPRPAGRRALVGSAPSRSAPRDWAGVLRALDRVRGRAFALRRPALLGQVYADRRLRLADAALLARLVPVGCGLRGVRTRYRGVRPVESRGRTVRLRAIASLPRSRLVCGGRQRSVAQPLAPVPLQIALLRTADGLRIVDEQRVA